MNGRRGSRGRGSANVMHKLIDRIHTTETMNAQ